MRVLNNRNSYRPDIDGLRAISVLSVIFYHYAFDLFGGGFVGVDIFFVISGYLITSHLYNEINGNTFSIFNFYSRRFKRILPALFSVIVFSLFAGYFLLLPGDFEGLSNSSIFAALGVSNFYFLLNTGYFDQSSDLMPLLHTWSLGVEEQFYLIWPLLFAISAKITKSAKICAFTILSIIIVVSFASSVVLTKHSPSFAFYLLPTRAWELGIGGMLAFAPKIERSLISYIATGAGLLIVMVSIFTINDKMPFPGAVALLPCIGAALIVWPKSNNLISRIISFKPAVFVGLISYSAYIWHWPILVFYRFYNDGFRPDRLESCILIIVTLVVSHLSHRFIEKPARKMKWSSVSVIKGGLLASCILAAFGYSISLSGGLPYRISDRIMALASFETMWTWSDCRLRSVAGIDKPVCYFGSDWEKAEHKIFLWGDSHAEHFAPILNAGLLGQNASGILFNRCAAAYGGSVSRYQPLLPNEVENCKKSYKIAVSFLQSHSEIKTVVLAASWVGKLEQLYMTDVNDRSLAKGKERLSSALVELAQAISAEGRNIIIVGPTPLWDAPNPVECYIASTGELPRRVCSPEHSTILSAVFLDKAKNEVEALKLAASQIPNSTFISPSDGLCGADSCATIINGEFLYRDSGHIRRNLKRDTLNELSSIIGINDAIKIEDTSGY
ncbi:MAG: acyltransferase [Candidatus Ochrobactrum gambitense]|nr:MAG: acyltransferase [Candidatus Ochrobactrum gambitense]WEK16970.1 MAG: acyltransferase family protein [Candidatus Ochrobactrum gambitense]